MKTKEKMCEDIAEINDRFEADEVVNLLDNVDLEKFVQFRARLLEEKCGDVWESADDRDAEAFIDSTIGAVVVALSTLEQLGVDVDRAWQNVIQAQLEKSRSCHINNHGYLAEIWPKNHKY